jgi:hypothetical protein
VIARWLYWPLLTAVLGFAVGGSVVWSISYTQPVANQRPAEQTEHRDGAATNTADQQGNPSSAPAAVPQTPSKSLSREKAANNNRAPKQPEKSWWDKLWSDPNATFAGAVALFTLALVVVGGVQAWRLRQSVEATNAAVSESRRIGEAQVRAYVHIKSASIDFVQQFANSPRVTFVASNSGQSTARNFLWNIILQYPVGAINKQRVLNPNWLNGTGIDIPATSDIPPEAAIIPDMSANELLTKGTTRTVVRAKIEHKFTDVFDKDWLGEAYFVGIMGATPLTVRETQVVGWTVGSFSQMPKPRDWDSVGNDQNKDQS